MAVVGQSAVVFLFVWKVRARSAAGKVVTWTKKNLTESLYPLPIITCLAGDLGKDHLRSVLGEYVESPFYHMDHTHKDLAIA